MLNFTRRFATEVVILVLLTTTFASSAEVVQIWKGRAPIGEGKFEKSDTQITVHRAAKDSGAAIVICPGGGYGGLVTGAEGHGIAKWLNGHGITGVVLEYRLPKGRPFVPLLDAQRAIRTVRANAKEWNIDPSQVGIIGFSAGGHLASTAATHFDDGDPRAKELVDRESCRPDFAILVYPVVTMGDETHGGSRRNLLGPDPSPKLIELFSNEKQVTKNTPPMFLAHALDDRPVPPENSKALFEALQAMKVPSQYLELPSGGHGLNGYKGPMWDAWQKQSLAWLDELKLDDDATTRLNGQTFTLPAGFTIEQVASPPLVNRPISADFDEQGRLYVTDVSGTNENVKIQVEKKPHRIVRLEDTNGDGKFDKSIVYADRLAFPEGACWLDGSLYVCAPPEIWKFTDTTNDGRADKRDVWFNGKTITHCANDLHGPYVGPDGWLYWCKGAFATQTYERPGRDPLVTRAAHIFRRRPEGGPIESVMTGGMDNPVDVVFTPGGERIFTTTFLVHPGNGVRDGLIHAVYGGVYGKEQGALDGHPRTGELMPILAHLGAAAPCGLARLESDQLGTDYKNNVLACSFNMHKITRHVLTKEGATFHSDFTDFLVSDNVDFHPTDVFEDADGSVLVVTTGGWYKLCCPTSQLAKPDILGAIYRVRRKDSHKVDDPRGRSIKWSMRTSEQLAETLNDERPAVARRAMQLLAKHNKPAVTPLSQVIQKSNDPNHRRQAVWAMTWIKDAAARSAVRTALTDKNETVRQAALHSISVWQDKAAEPLLARLLSRGQAHNRRAAAEAIGRIGTSASVSKIFEAVEDCDNRPLEHSLIYAAMEIGDAKAIREQLASANNSRVRRAAMIALDQMPGGDLPSNEVIPYLTSDDPILHETAWWIVDHHPQWAGEMADYFQSVLRQKLNDEDAAQLTNRLARFAGAEAIQKVMAERMQHDATPTAVRLAILNAMAASRQKPIPPAWTSPLLAQLSSDAPNVLAAAVSAVKTLTDAKPDESFTKRLQQLASETQRSADVRLQAMLSLPAGSRNLDAATLNFVCGQMNLDQSVVLRSLAVDVVTSTPLGAEQLQTVAGVIPTTGAMELQRLMAMFAKLKDAKVGLRLVAALDACPAATSLFPDKLKEQLSGFGLATLERAQPLLARIEKENRDKLARVETILALMAKADARNGHQVFKSSKASCLACHRRGYIGNNIGPDLNRIGSVRTERDLLESILFPSLTFVRSYEPVSIITSDGKIHSGTIRDENREELTLQLDAQKSVRIPIDEIDERQQGTVSIMPAGLEKQLSPQDLADLVKFLREGR